MLFNGLISRTPSIKLLSHIIHFHQIKKRQIEFFLFHLWRFPFFSSPLSVETNTTSSSFYFYGSLQYSLSSLQLHKLLISISVMVGKELSIVFCKFKYLHSKSSRDYAGWVDEENVKKSETLSLVSLKVFSKLY